MTLLEAIHPELPAVVAIAGFGGKSTILGELRAAGPNLTLMEVTPGEPVPSSATLVVVVAGLDVIGQSVLPGPPLAPSAEGWERLGEGPITPNELASLLSKQRAAVRTVYVLNKTDDEFCLQQAKQIAAALLPELTLATVDGQLVWPHEDEPA